MFSIGFIAFFIIYYCFVRIYVYVAQIFSVNICTSPIFRFCTDSRNLSRICRPFLHRTNSFSRYGRRIVASSVPAADRRLSRPGQTFLPHGTCPVPETCSAPDDERLPSKKKGVSGFSPKTPSCFLICYPAQGRRSSLRLLILQYGLSC